MGLADGSKKAVRRAADGAEGGWSGRWIRILLALYLTPALLVVLLVGGIGLLVMGAAQAIGAVARGPEAPPRSPIKPGSHVP